MERSFAISGSALSKYCAGLDFGGRVARDCSECAAEVNDGVLFTFSESADHHPRSVIVPNTARKSSGGGHQNLALSPK